MKLIQLSRGQVALVDDEDFEELSKYNWYAMWCRNSKKFYAARNISTSKKHTILMHRQILGLTDSRTQVDHEDSSGLNNQRYNLRIVTNQQNQFNQKRQLNSSSKYKGVTWREDMNKWVARIKINRKTKHLGCFIKETDAAIAYNEAARKLFGEFALLNEVYDEQTYPSGC